MQAMKAPRKGYVFAQPRAVPFPVAGYAGTQPQAVATGARRRDVWPEQAWRLLNSAASRRLARLPDCLTWRRSGPPCTAGGLHRAGNGLPCAQEDGHRGQAV